MNKRTKPVSPIYSEHLMFGGSTHIEDYDKHVQLAGGESNAYTDQWPDQLLH